MLIISEPQALTSLPTFVADITETQFRAKLSQASPQGAVTYLPEATYYLLRTYSTASAMRELL